MSKEFKHIDDLLKNTLEGYSKEPSSRVWRNISIRLYGLRAGIYLSVFVLLIIAGFFYLLPSVETEAGLSHFDPPDSEFAVVIHGEKEPSNNKKSTQGADEKLIDEEISEKQGIEIKAENNQGQKASPGLPIDAAEKTKEHETLDNAIASNQNHFSVYPGLGRLNEPPALYQKEGYLLFDFPVRLGPYQSTIATRNVYGKSTGGNITDYAKTDAMGLGFTITPEIIINENYKNNSTLNFDLSINYFRNDWFVQGGIGIGLTQDDGVFDVQYAQYDSIGYYSKVNSFSVDPATGQLIYKTDIEGLYDTVEYFKEATTKNYYSYLRLPIYAGINLRNFKRWSIDLKGGAIYSVLLNKVEGDFMYDNNNVTWIKINDETPERIKSNIQLSAALAFNYQINQNLYFHVEPVYSYYLNSVYVKQYNIKSPYSLGLRTGLLLKF